MESIDVQLARSEDESEWEGFVAASAMGTAFQSPAWAAFLQQRGDSSFALLARRGSCLVGTALVRIRRVGPFVLAETPRGPVLADPLDRPVAERLLSEIVRHARATGAVRLRVSPDLEVDTAPAQSVSSILSQLDFRHIDEGDLHASTFRVSLAADEGELLRRMEKRAWAAVQKGLSAGVEVRNDLDGARVEEFVPLFRETADRHAMRAQGSDFFHSVSAAFMTRNVARLFVAYGPDTSPLAAAIVFFTNKRAFYVWGASTGRLRNLHASQVLHWKIMLWAKSRGLAEYDLHGALATQPGDPGWGVYLFKRGFGGRFTNLIGEWEISLRPIRHGVYRALRALRDSLPLGRD